MHQIRTTQSKSSKVPASRRPCLKLIIHSTALRGSCLPTATLAGTVGSLKAPHPQTVCKPEAHTACTRACRHACSPHIPRTRRPYHQSPKHRDHTHRGRGDAAQSRPPQLSDPAATHRRPVVLGQRGSLHGTHDAHFPTDATGVSFRERGKRSRTQLHLCNCQPLSAAKFMSLEGSAAWRSHVRVVMPAASPPFSMPVLCRPLSP